MVRPEIVSPFLEKIRDLNVSDEEVYDSFKEINDLLYQDESELILGRLSHERPCVFKKFFDDLNK